MYPYRFILLYSPSHFLTKPFNKKLVPCSLWLVVWECTIGIEILGGRLIFLPSTTAITMVLFAIVIVVDMAFE